MFLTRRVFALAAFAAPLAGAIPAHAATFQPYTPAAFAAATKAGGPVFVHVYAPWCLQCRAQEGILERLMAEPRYANATFFRVSYDQQKDVVAKLDVPRSTLIAYKGGRETGRMSWGVTQDAVQKVLDTAA
ncbi:thioredoxin family protein [Aquabacter sp. L1I39]|uniref:thioredoxin family protein n=1 Tax=Aquabacter sp. L1I39 TaxID=2820278 RepID=UPI001AD9A155|nr:thioredoxin family protein [Aquabacter sp. L1I39]QTL03369.1 thioredoxin family protein [Aquabacter sp. L1I39]